MILSILKTGCYCQKPLEKRKSSLVKISLSADAALPFHLSPKLVMVLPKGEKDGQVSWRKKFSSWCTLDTIAVDDSGRILVVDHPSFHQGARAQLFDAKGNHIYTLLLPFGSCIFRLSPDGYLYHGVSKGKTSYEKVMLYKPNGKFIREYPLRPAYNTVDIFFNNSHQLYIYLLVYLLDKAEGEDVVKLSQRLIYIGDKTQAEPPSEMGKRGAVATMIGEDNYLYVLDYQFKELQQAKEVEKKLLKVSQEGKIKRQYRLAPFMKLYYVDAAGNLYFLVEQDDTTWLGSSAYLGDIYPPFEELWKYSPDGELLNYYPIPTFKRFFFLEGKKIAINSKGQIYLAKASSKGVEIYRYEVK